MRTKKFTKEKFDAQFNELIGWIEKGLTTNEALDCVDMGKSTLYRCMSDEQKARLNEAQTAKSKYGHNF